MMKFVKAFLLLASLAASLGYVLAAPLADPHSRGAAAPADRRAAARARAQELFVSNCARCHGADGAGQTRLGQTMDAPDMTDPAWQRQRSDRRLRESITNGRDEMPAFGSKLSKSDVSALVAHVRRLRRR